MSEQPPSRFTPQNQTTNERLSSNTVGLVHLSDFRKRRAEVLDQQGREAHEAASTGNSTPDRSLSATPNASDSASGEGVTRPAKKKKRKAIASKLSFGGGDDDDENNNEDDDAAGDTARPLTVRKTAKAKNGTGPDGNDGAVPEKKFKITANASVGMVPRAKTKATLQREAAERERLRKEFLVIQEAVKATEVAIPFVFYDGTDIPGGVVRVRKGDHIWVCLDKSRKVGAALGVGDKANARREWARVGVDDLMLVRGSVIIPHHLEFYFFVMNNSRGPGGHRLFDYSADAPPAQSAVGDVNDPAEDAKIESTPPASQGGLTTAAALKAAAHKSQPDISTLEGANDDPTFTKVVDRRWYERNKHIYPASTWQEFDPEKDYQQEIRKDAGGNTFFFSR